MKKILLLPHLPLLYSSLKSMFVCTCVHMHVCMREYVLWETGIYFSNYISEGIENIRLLFNIGKIRCQGS